MIKDRAIIPPEAGMRFLRGSLALAPRGSLWGMLSAQQSSDRCCLKSPPRGSQREESPYVAGTCLLVLPALMVRGCSDAEVILSPGV